MFLSPWYATTLFAVHNKDVRIRSDQIRSDQILSYLIWSFFEGAETKYADPMSGIYKLSSKIENNFTPDGKIPRFIDSVAKPFRILISTRLLYLFCWFVRSCSPVLFHRLFTQFQEIEFQFHKIYNSTAFSQHKLIQLCTQRKKYLFGLKKLLLWIFGFPDSVFLVSVLHLLHNILYSASVAIMQLKMEWSKWVCYPQVADTSVECVRCCCRLCNCHAESRQ